MSPPGGRRYGAVPSVVVLLYHRRVQGDAENSPDECCRSARRWRSGHASLEAGVYGHFGEYTRTRR